MATGPSLKTPWFCVTHTGFEEALDQVTRIKIIKKWFVYSPEKAMYVLSISSNFIIFYKAFL